MWVMGPPGLVASARVDNNGKSLLPTYQGAPEQSPRGAMARGSRTYDTKAMYSR